MKPAKNSHIARKVAQKTPAPGHGPDVRYRSDHDRRVEADLEWQGRGGWWVAVIGLLVLLATSIGAMILLIVR